MPPNLAPLDLGPLVHVRVDRESGEVARPRLRHRPGRRPGAQPAIIEGQLHGGATQGLGWALREAMVYDDAGQLLTGTFLDYVMPLAPRCPTSRRSSSRSRRPTVRTARKGIGEGPVCGAAAAVANAMTAATGVRFRTLPMTAPARLARA